MQFQPGDRVRYIGRSDHRLTNGSVYTVRYAQWGRNGRVVIEGRYENGDRPIQGRRASEFEPAAPLLHYRDFVTMAELDPQYARKQMVELERMRLKPRYVIDTETLLDSFTMLELKGIRPETTKPQGKETPMNPNTAGIPTMQPVPTPYTPTAAELEAQIAAKREALVKQRQVERELARAAERQKKELEKYRIEAEQQAAAKALAAQEKAARKEVLENMQSLASATLELLAAISSLDTFGGAPVHRKTYVKHLDDLQPLANRFGCKLVLIGDKTLASLVRK